MAALACTRFLPSATQLELRGESHRTGYCYGAALTIIALALKGLNLADKKAVYSAYRRTIGNVIALQSRQRTRYRPDGLSLEVQRLYYELFSTGTVDPKRKQETVQQQALYSLVQDFLNKEEAVCLRSYLKEHGPPGTEAAQIDIVACYHAVHHPDQHRYRFLQREVMTELAELQGIALSESKHFHADKKQLVAALFALREGIYHVAVPGHAFAFVVNQAAERILWDINRGSKVCAPNEEGLRRLKRAVVYSRKAGWVTITRCE